MRSPIGHAHRTRAAHCTLDVRPARHGARARHTFRARSAGLGAVVAGLLALPLLAACSQDPAEDYCAAVTSHQREIGEAAGTGGPDALLGALGAFRDLAAKAPSDITDEWSQLIGSLEGLQGALDDAGVDPSTYDPEEPPAGLSEQDRGRIDAAAADLVSAQTTAALSGLEQQARDVCQTQLSL